jgi:hypothetical protein
MRNYKSEMYFVEQFTKLKILIVFMTQRTADNRIFGRRKTICQILYFEVF